MIKKNSIKPAMLWCCYAWPIEKKSDHVSEPYPLCNKHFMDTADADDSDSLLLAQCCCSHENNCQSNGSPHWKKEEIYSNHTLYTTFYSGPFIIYKVGKFEVDRFFCFKWYTKPECKAAFYCLNGGHNPFVLCSPQFSKNPLFIGVLRHSLTQRFGKHHHQHLHLGDHQLLVKYPVFPLPQAWGGKAHTLIGHPAPLKRKIFCLCDVVNSSRSETFTFRDLYCEI